MKPLAPSFHNEKAVGNPNNADYAPAARSFPRVSLFGVPFSDISFDELCSTVESCVREKKFCCVVTPNVDHVCRFHRDADFRKAYLNADIVLCDGTPILWASRLLRRPLREKLSGSDLVFTMSEFAARRALSVFLFGAAEGVAELAAQRLKKAYPGLRVAGVYSPPFGFMKDPRLIGESVRIVRDAKPDICYVALGAPLQEFWIQNHGVQCDVPVMIGVGGSLDFAAGRLRRAPVWAQNAGVEWVWRLIQEPRRLWRRYLIEDLLIFRLFWHEWRNRRTQHSNAG